MLVTTVGSAVPPGQPMIEIVPSEDNLLVEAMVKPKDIAFVRIGQRARVNFGISQNVRRIRQNRGGA